MRIAWFRDTAPDLTDPLDDTASLIDELRSAHEIDVIVAPTAHDFVWQHILRPWNLCVFELDKTRTHRFVWAYLLNYAGVVFLRSADVATLRVPLLASRSVVVSHPAFAESLQRAFPTAHIRYAPPCGGPTGFALHESGNSRRGANDHDRRGADLTGPPLTKFAVFDRRGGGIVHRAFQRAGDAGAVFDVRNGDAEPNVLTRCDVAIAPGWPPYHGAPTAVLAALAAGKAVVTMEMEPTAEWPAIDPQTWRPRGLSVKDAPIAVTIDPRDEEHSLMLAVRRLSSDSALREQLGRAGHAWWQENATPAHAAAAWMQILEEAATLAPPPRPDDWPTQFGADGTELARAILSEFGLSTRI
jgi:hypothetical protein